MEYIIQEKKNRIFKRISIIILILIFAFLCFNAGMYVTQKNRIAQELANKELVFTGKVLGKYGRLPEDRLAQDNQALY